MKKLFRHWIPAYAGMTIKIAGMTSLLLFSFYLMFHTVSYSTRVGSITIASKAWSDFGAHIPLIRSFSKGDNLNRLIHRKPVESPLFPNEPIRYHFGFYALVGLLERLGVRLDYAINIPSALGFFLMLVMIFVFSYTLFTNVAVSILSVIFTLFNGSLSFLRFFNTHPLSLNTLKDIITNTTFPSFGPWDSGLISAFWSLNIYTNQRHLSTAYGISLLLIWFIVRTRSVQQLSLIKTMLFALAMSVLLFIHFPAAAMTMVFLFWIFIVQKNTRRFLFIAGIITIPALVMLISTTRTGSPTIDIGYLVQKPITAISFFTYWFYNLGLHIIFIPLGILLSPRLVRRLIVVPLLLLFLIPNVFRLSPDMINNHKFFNFFMIIGGMFSAYAVVRIGRIKRMGLISLICITFLLIFSGIIDLFPIINDSRGSIANLATQRDVEYFQIHTSPTDIIANSTWFYHPASVAGRAIFSGYTYFTWSYGYNQSLREQQLVSVYQATNLTTLCSLLSAFGISYIELSKTPEAYIHPNLTLWNEIPPDYTNPKTNLRVYAKNTLCNH